MFAGLQTVIVDEVHALAGTKRGDQLALCIARLARWRRGCAGSAFRPRSRIKQRAARLGRRRSGR